MNGPLIAVTLEDNGREVAAGERLVCQYQIDGVAASELAAVEASVLWYTEGKGEEDLGVHFFERRTPGEIEGGDLRVLRRFTTVLPHSPLSYEGTIVKIRWCVRVRAFLSGGRDVSHDLPFRLTPVAAQELLHV